MRCFILEGINFYELALLLQSLNLQLFKTTLMILYIALWLNDKNEYI